MVHLQAFQYLVPALFLNATVYTVRPLGNLSTGGSLVYGGLKSGTLQSEPGFKPSFHASIYGDDYPSIDPDGVISRLNLRALVVPDDGATPFELRATGIQIGSPESAAIVTGQADGKVEVPYGIIYSVLPVSFFGGGEDYKILQDSVFVGSEAVSTGEKPGEFLVGIKISRVVPVVTNGTIGHEFP